MIGSQPVRRPSCSRVPFPLFLTIAASTLPLLAQSVAIPNSLFGYRDFAAQAQIDRQFLAVPDARLAGEELKSLTAVPHVAGSKEDYDTAVYVANKFKDAGLETTIVPYKAWLNLPQSVNVEAMDSSGKVFMQGPSKEHVSSDPYPGRSAGSACIQWFIALGRRDR